jgi:rRNA-processing protein FCF1
MAVALHPTAWSDDMEAALGKFEPVILDCVKIELQKISSGRGRKARLASLALELAREFSAGPCGRFGVDDEIASTALATGAIVATVDGELMRVMRTLGVRVVSLRSGRVALL